MVRTEVRTIGDDLEEEMQVLEVDSELKPGAVVTPKSDADDGLSEGQKVAVVTGRWRVPLWHIATGLKRMVNGNMARAILRKRDKLTGARIFSAKPMAPVFMGKLKCVLHADSPRHEEFLARGFPTCIRTQLPTEFAVQRHMRHRHPQEFSTLEQERQSREREEDRDLQRQILSRMSPVAVAPAAPTAALPEILTESGKAKRWKMPFSGTHDCLEHRFKGRSKASLTAHKRHKHKGE